jgi:tetratricopeptide (TPR) repeat protein
MNKLLFVFCLAGFSAGAAIAEESNPFTVVCTYQWQQENRRCQQAFTEICRKLSSIPNVHLMTPDSVREIEELSLAAGLKWDDRLYSLNQLYFKYNVDALLFFSDKVRKPAILKIECIDIMTGRVMGELAIKDISSDSQLIPSLQRFVDGMNRLRTPLGFPFLEGERGLMFLADTAQYRTILEKFYQFQRLMAQFDPARSVFLKALKCEPCPQDLCGLDASFFYDTGAAFVLSAPDSADSTSQCLMRYRPILLPVAHFSPPYQNFLESFSCFKLRTDEPTLQWLAQVMIARDGDIAFLQSFVRSLKSIAGPFDAKLPFIYNLALELQSTWCGAVSPEGAQVEILDELYNFLADHLTPGSLEQAWLYLNYAHYDRQLKRDDRALTWIAKAIPVFNQQADSLGLTVAFLEQARTHNTLEEWSQARDAYQTTLRFVDAINDSVSMAAILFQMGILSETMMQSDEAFSYYQHSAGLAIALHDTVKIIQAYEHIHPIFHTMGRFDDELRTINDIIALASVKRNPAVLARAFFHRGALALKQNRTAAALDDFQQSGDYMEMVGDSLGLARVDINTGACFFQLGYLEQAGLKYVSALSISESLADSKGILQCHMNLGELCLKQNNFSQAWDHFDTALTYANQLNDTTAMASLYYSKGMACLKMGRLKSACEEIRNALQLSKSATDPVRTDGEALLLKLEAMMKEDQEKN